VAQKCTGDGTRLLLKVGNRTYPWICLQRRWQTAGFKIIRLDQRNHRTGL
jgi:hypothetical protein